MKQTINYTTSDIPHSVQRYITLWKTKKKYMLDPFLTFGQVVELIIATTYTYYHEESDGRFFNNALIGEEATILWDGEEPIDIFFYEATQLIKKRLARAHTFNESLE